jgi:hypothetical protein
MVGFVGGPGRAPILTAFLVALMCALPATAGAASPFHQVVRYSAADIESDGVRYALVHNYPDPPLVFDTLRGHRFRPAAPVAECRYRGFGAGLLVWNCPPPRRTLITNLATALTREPAGIEQVDARTSEYGSCSAYGIGRHWLAFSCGGTYGPHDEMYLNHRTGKIADVSQLDYDRRPYVLDLNYDGLVRYICHPLAEGLGVSTFSPPFGLAHAPWGDLGSDNSGLTLRRCGQKQAETLSRCHVALCATPQLGSRYVTWGEDDVVLAYLPRIRRRVPIGRAPGLDAYSPVGTVAHTCTRVFAKWSYSVYVARFEPRHGAPPCQAVR